MGGDLLGNFDLRGGMVGCHSSWDLVTTVTGDLALTKDEEENNRQRLLMWMALPKGERIDPSIGCCLHDYFHAKISGHVLKSLELDIENELKTVFPDAKISNVRVKKVAPLSDGTREIIVDVTINNDRFAFQAISSVLDGLNEYINDMMYHGGASL